MKTTLKPTARTFFRFAVPSVASMLVYSLYTMMDGIFLSHAVGEYALAAINLVMPYINAVFALAVFLSMGTSTLISLALGRGEKERANRIFTQNAYVLFVFSAVLAVLVILAVLLKVFVIANYTVSGTSMEPTLSEGDWVWVNKVAEPKRGDIVVAYEPSSGKALVKRVVAIEGDTVSLEWKDTGYVVVVQTKEGEKLYDMIVEATAEIVNKAK